MLTRRAALNLLAASPWAANAFAQAIYPNQPVKIVVTFAAGGSADITGRLVARVLQERLKASFVVENRAGAGGTIGLGGVAQAKPDGYTLGICAAGGMVMLPHLIPKMPYDPQRSFQPISLVMTVPQVMAVKKSLGIKTLAELVALAKQKPGALTYGSAGHGTSLHFASELFKLRAGNLDIQHVPYRGVAPALTDIMGGQIDILFGDIPVLLPQIQAGTIVALAVTAEKQVEVLPNVPTMAEAGVSGAEAESFYGLLGPAGLPKDILDLLHSNIAKALVEPDTRRLLVDQGEIVVGNSPSEFATYLASEYKKWGEVAKLANITMQ